MESSRDLKLMESTTNYPVISFAPDIEEIKRERERKRIKVSFFS